MIIVSACLVGINCKYDGKNNFVEGIAELMKKGIIMPICPEQLGGLETPRLPAEIVGGGGKEVLEGKGRVLRINGEDVTKEFIKGAEESLYIARYVKPEALILKSKSPSCGFGKIYDGTFSKTLKDGNGVTAELLSQNGFIILNERNFNLYLNSYNGGLL